MEFMSWNHPQMMCYIIYVTFTHGVLAALLKNKSLERLSETIVPFHNDFSLSGEQPEQRKLAHTL